ncbi:oxalate decarboxylase [Mycena amicta]|nr:oxalate decarboxylase [Mycena amicta]
MISVASCLCALSSLSLFLLPPPPRRWVEASSSGTASATSSATLPSSTVPLVSTEPNNPLWNFTSGTPEPIRGSLGATILGPVNLPIEKENPDVLARRLRRITETKNAKWPFDLSHMRLQTGGWARRRILVRFLVKNSVGFSSDATMAAVDMRLEAGAIRELHWHTASEWGGWTQISAVDTDGRNFLATVGPGDLWFFPPGIPHSLQATNQTAEGSEFLLVFDNGAFSDDGTFLLTDWMSHVPYEVIMKNFQTTDVEAFCGNPCSAAVYIPWTCVPFTHFAVSDPNPNALPPSDPVGQIPANESYSFALSQLPAKNLTGGSIKVADTTNFPISNTVVVAEITVNPGAMRELHWHPTMDEMDYFLEGEARMTLFAAEGNARTFDYQPGDIGLLFDSKTLRYLEILNGALFQDLSLNQWLALTPPEVVKAHLGLSDATIASLMKVKPIVI